MTKLPDELTEWIEQESEIARLETGYRPYVTKRTYQKAATAMAHHLLNKPKADEKVAGREFVHVTILQQTLIDLMSDALELVAAVTKYKESFSHPRLICPELITALVNWHSKHKKGGGK